MDGSSSQGRCWQGRSPKDSPSEFEDENAASGGPGRRDAVMTPAAVH